MPLPGPAPFPSPGADRLCPRCTPRPTHTRGQHVPSPCWAPGQKQPRYRRGRGSSSWAPGLPAPFPTTNSSLFAQKLSGRGTHSAHTSDRLGNAAPRAAFIEGRQAHSGCLLSAASPDPSLLSHSTTWPARGLLSSPTSSVLLLPSPSPLSLPLLSHFLLSSFSLLSSPSSCPSS